MNNCLTGTAQVSCAVPACPLVTVGSLIAGIGLTTFACIRCNCADDKFLTERDQVCKCYGLVQGMAITKMMFTTGVENIKRSCGPYPVPKVESTMTRN